MKTKKITPLVFVFFLPIWLFSKQIGHDTNEGTYKREGSKITYSWSHLDENGIERQFGLWIRFGTDWNYMQRVYREKNHNHGKYRRFVQHDPFKQSLKLLANILRKMARENGISETRLALSFVQALPYQEMGSYQRYAVETLIDCKGDCSDTSVLLAGIYNAWGYDCIFLRFNDHLAVGIWSNYISGSTYYRHRSRNFYYCESTGTGWTLGKRPPGYSWAYIEEVC